MSVEFRNPDVLLETSALHIVGEIVNLSAEAWLPEDGWALG